MRYGSQRQSFHDLCGKSLGREVIYTNATTIDKSNVVEELGKALSLHWRNREEVEYLDRYYRGNQPILYRVKENRPEINNKVVENHAYEIVEHKTSEMFGEPVQYVLNGTDKTKSLYIQEFNKFMDYEDKQCDDVSLGRWRSICGTAYRFVWTEIAVGQDETPFGTSILDPKHTFVVYSSCFGNKPMFSVQQYKNADGENEYYIYTKSQTFVVNNSKVTEVGINGIGIIPVIEYPNNERRISDIEIVITMLDTLNKMQSDRMNGVEQFVQAFIKFVNCDIDKDKFIEMCNIGALKVNTTNSSYPADVGSVANELNQEQTQVAKDDLYDNMLIIEGMPDRQENSGGDTGQAVVLRNGFYFSEKRAEINEPIFKKSERQFLRCILKIVNTKSEINLLLSDIEIKVTRSKMDNMQVKAQVLQMLLACGIEQSRAIKTINLWSDPEQVCIESKPYLDAKYNPNTQGGGISNETKNTTMQE